MSNVEIFKKIIEKAIKNKWLSLPIEKIKDINITFYNFNSIFIKIEWLEKVKNADVESFYFQSMKDIIFSHDFAKAFWGEEQIIKNIAAPTRFINKDLDEMKGTWGWKYYLSKLVLLSDNEKFKYLEKFL